MIFDMIQEIAVRYAKLGLLSIGLKNSVSVKPYNVTLLLTDYRDPVLCRHVLCSQICQNGLTIIVISAPY